MLGDLSRRLVRRGRASLAVTATPIGPSLSLEVVWFLAGMVVLIISVFGLSLFSTDFRRGLGNGLAHRIDLLLAILCLLGAFC